MFIELWQIISLSIPFIVWILGVTITLRLLFKKNPISVTFSWLLMIYLIPIVGIAAYILFGEVNLGRKRAELFNQLAPQYKAWFNNVEHCSNLTLDNNTLTYKPLFSLCQNQLGIPCLRGNQLQLLTQYNDIIDSILETIQNAQKRIEMVFYIWQSGGRVDEVINALIVAQQRGVEIKILLDSVGSRAFLRSQTCQTMCDAGIQISEALHVSLWRLFLRRLDLRQHRKIIVIDNQIGFTGSMNMVDPAIFKKETNIGKWVDIMVRIEGPVALILHGLHHWDWSIENDAKHDTDSPLPEHIECPNIHPNEKHAFAVQMIASGPGFPNDLVVQSLLTIIYSARDSLTITSPYFVPNQSVAMALKIAALRGVKVTIIVPEKSDSTLVEWASRTFFGELLRAGVKIYRFRDGLLHTKSIIVDGRLAQIGTVNMDLRSFHLNFELMMIVDDIAFAKKVTALHQNYLAQSELINLEEWLKRPLLYRFWERVNFLFSPLL